MQAEFFHNCSDRSDLVSLRSVAAQAMISGHPSGPSLMQDYANLLEASFVNILNYGRAKPSPVMDGSSLSDGSRNLSTISTSLGKRPLDHNTEDFILSFLLSETQGGVRTTTKLVDLTLPLTNMSSGFDEHFRFRLGLGLAKLGLHDLSVKQVGLAAVQRDTPLFRLRAKLVFPPVHSSIGTLAAAVNHFERQMESILLHEIPQNAAMTQVCNSLSEAAWALQALPLLHLIGFSAPRVGNALGHLPIPLPILLGEVYLHMCPDIVDNSFDITPQHYLGYLQRHPPALSTSSALSRDIALLDVDSGSSLDGTVDNAARGNAKKDPTGGSNTNSNKNMVKRKLHIGIVAGSFDSLPGRIMIGLLDTFPDKLRKIVEFTAMCFPTPRSAVTDRVNALFDHHINLSTDNKTQVLARIADAHVDFVLFADAAMDARVFALAHERLALYQGSLWSWGGTLGIGTIDFVFQPEIFLQHSRCKVHHSHRLLLQQQQQQSANSAQSFQQQNTPKHLPQQHFTEQVVWLTGIPELLPRAPALRTDDAVSLLHQRFLLELSNRTHIYLFPASVKHFHPEFDRAVEVIFRTDPLAIVVLAVVKTGRDHLPTTHLAVTHDLLHPAMPLAGVYKLKQRLRTVIKANPDRIRVLPPLDEALYRALLRQAVAVLDPYPVGLHTAVLEAMLDGVPVITAPALQECTNSHAFSLARYLRIMPRQGIPEATTTATMLQENDGGDAQHPLKVNISKYQRPGASSNTAASTGSGAHTLNANGKASPPQQEVIWQESNFFPTSAEEYGVLAVRVAKDTTFRQQFLLAQETIVHHAELYHAITVDAAASLHDLLPMAHHAQQFFAQPNFGSGRQLNSNNNSPDAKGKGSTGGHNHNAQSSKAPHRPTHLEQIVRFVQQLFIAEVMQ